VEIRASLDDFTATICLDPKDVSAYKLCAELYSRYDQFQNALQDSEMVLKLDPNSPNASCNVGIAHYALGDDAEGRQFINTCYQKDPDPQTRGYNETEVRKVLFARQSRRSGGRGVTVGRAREDVARSGARIPVERLREPPELRIRRPRRGLPER
jgi:predicted Zn-dependent protease